MMEDYPAARKRRAEVDGQGDLARDYIKDVLSILYPNAPEEASFQYGYPRLGLKLLPHQIAELDERFRVQGSQFVHFTSIRSLFSILNERAIRMYDLTHANDPNETTFMADCLGLSSEALDEQNSSRALSVTLKKAEQDLGYSSVERQLIEERRQRFERFKRFRQSTMLLSMCDPGILDPVNVNALNPWRFYGDEGYGCAIELAFEGMTEGQMDDCRYMIGNVMYGSMDEGRSSKNGEPTRTERFRKAHQEFEAKRSIQVHVEQLLAVPACLYKNPYYQVEQEVRLLKIGSDYDQIDPVYSDPEMGFDYNGRGDLVRYWRLPLWGREGLRVSIQRIHLGFLVDNSSRRELEEILNKMLNRWRQEAECEIGKVEVVPSPLGKVFRR